MWVPHVRVLLFMENNYGDVKKCDIGARVMSSCCQQCHGSTAELSRAWCARPSTPARLGSCRSARRRRRELNWRRSEPFGRRNRRRRPNLRRRTPRTAKPIMANVIRSTTPKSARTERKRRRSSPWPAICPERSASAAVSVGGGEEFGAAHEKEGGGGGMWWLFYKKDSGLPCIYKHVPPPEVLWDARFEW